MAKLKVKPLGFSAEGYKVGQVVEGELDGKPAEGTVLEFKNPEPGQPVKMGHKFAELRPVPGKTYFDMEILDGNAKPSKIDFEDQSRDGRQGPAKVNSKAYRSGWDHTFKN